MHCCGSPGPVGASEHREVWDLGTHLLSPTEQGANARKLPTSPEAHEQCWGAWKLPQACKKLQACALCSVIPAADCPKNQPRELKFSPCCFPGQPRGKDAVC
ncbi:hypothetical protein GRJ2_002031300 [Grus japonensis]|uniref:Uncharacterized protein n=1 Tax=Grus japonensis TaxID=30415 RepID=A0ABC9XEU5_GRUJA